MNLNEQRLEVGEPFPRNDGRLYIPMSVLPHRPRLPNVIMTVPADSFATLSEAQTFAEELSYRWNRHL